MVRGPQEGLSPGGAFHPSSPLAAASNVWRAAELDGSRTRRKRRIGCAAPNLLEAWQRPLAWQRSLARTPNLPEAWQRPLARQEDEEEEEDCWRRHLKGLHLRWLEASPERVTSPAAERRLIEPTGGFT